MKPYADIHTCIVVVALFDTTTCTSMVEITNAGPPLFQRYHYDPFSVRQVVCQDVKQ